MQLERQRTLKRNNDLLEGLVELKMQDPDVGSYLSPEYKKVCAAVHCPHSWFDVPTFPRFQACTLRFQ